MTDEVNNEGRRPFFKKPVDKGQKLSVKIESMGQRGDGVAKIDGYVIFVKGEGLEVGKEVNIEVQTVGRKFATAIVV